MVSVSKDGLDAWIDELDRYDAWGADDRCLDIFNQLKKLLEACHDALAKLETTSKIIAELPNIGQFITKIGRHPQLMLEEGIYERFLKCTMVLIPADPQTPIEHRAAQWGQTLIRKSYSYFHQPSPCDRLAEPGEGYTRNYHEFAIEQLKKSICRKLDDLNKQNSDFDGVQDDDQSSAALLRDISNQMAPLVRFPACHPVLEKLLLCNNALTKTALSERFLASLLELQARRFEYPRSNSGKEGEMSERTCVVLWTSHLPALEHAVMSYIRTLSSRPFIGFQEAVNLLSSSHLPRACYDHSTLHRAVDQILRSLLFATEGSAVVLRAIYIFQFCHIQLMKLSSNNKSRQYNDVVPPRQTSLEAMLRVLPSDVSSSSRVDHLSSVCSFVRQLQADSVTTAAKLDFWFLVAKHQHWYNQCLIGAFTEGSPLRELCRQFVGWFHNPISTTKDSLGAVEVCCESIQSGQLLAVSEGQHQTMYYQLLMAYVVGSARKGTGYMNKILTLVPDSGEFTTVAFLLEVLETFNYNLADESKGIIVKSLQEYAGMIRQNGQDWIDIKRRMDSELKSLDNG